MENDATVGPCVAGDEKSDVLQFLLGVAPLQKKHKGFNDDNKKPNACGTSSDSTSPGSLSRVSNDGSERANDPEDAIPVLEYTPEYESDDYYIELEESIAQVEAPGKDVSAVDSNIAAVENARGGEDQALDENEDGGNAQPTLLDLPDLVDASELDHDVEEVAFNGDFKCSPIMSNEVGFSDTGSNCTDHDRGSSDGEESRGGIVEIEEEPSEQPELLDFIHKLGDDLANTVKESSCRKPSSPLDDPAMCSFVCNRSDRIDINSLKTVEASSDRDESESVTSNTSATDESHHEEDQDESYDASIFCSQSPPHHTKQKHHQNAYESSIPSRAELLFVTCVAAAFVLYVHAPDAVRYIERHRGDHESGKPVAAATICADVHRVDVGRLPGASDRDILYEIGLLSISTLPGGDEDRTAAIDLGSTTPGIQDTVLAPRRATFNTTIRHRIAAAHVLDFGTYTIRVEAQFPIPGSEDGMQTLTQSVTMTKALEVYRTLELLSPSNGSTFAEGESVLLEYKATHVDELEIAIDGSLGTLVRHIDDGNFLLRGLGVGTHTIQLLGYDVHGNTIASSKEVHVIHIQ
ncbi:hypothetical protein FI667_g3189, partial [Globisporangium splendens]